MQDAELVQGLREQDPAAVQHLSECYLPTVWRFVYVRVRDEHLAEDIVSETVLALIRTAADDHSNIDSPSAWLRTVARNKINDHFRAAARVQHLIDRVKQSSGNNDGPAQPSERQERSEHREEIRGVLDKLSEQERLALEWKYVDKLSVRDIAGRLGVTEKAAESILFRARRDFKDKMERADSAADGPACRDDCCRHSVSRDLRPAEGNAGPTGLIQPT